jgi:hypothetical protein
MSSPAQVPAQAPGSRRSGEKRPRSDDDAVGSNSKEKTSKKPEGEAGEARDLEAEYHEIISRCILPDAEHRAAHVTLHGPIRYDRGPWADKFRRFVLAEQARTGHDFCASSSSRADGKLPTLLVAFTALRAFARHYGSYEFLVFLDSVNRRRSEGSLRCEGIPEIVCERKGGGSPDSDATFQEEMLKMPRARLEPSAEEAKCGIFDFALFDETVRKSTAAGKVPSRDASPLISATRHILLNRVRLVNYKLISITGTTDSPSDQVTGGYFIGGYHNIKDLGPIIERVKVIDPLLRVDEMRQTFRFMDTSETDEWSEMYEKRKSNSKWPCN